MHIANFNGHLEGGGGDCLPLVRGCTAPQVDTPGQTPPLPDTPQVDTHAGQTPPGQTCPGKTPPGRHPQVDPFPRPMNAGIHLHPVNRMTSFGAGNKTKLFFFRIPR